MVKETDIAWLAGIIDGEGCFSVKNPVKRGTGRTCHQVWIVLCNTSESMVVRAEQIMAELSGCHVTIRRTWKGKKAKRWQYWVNVARKESILAVTEALLPHLTAKKTEAEAIVWFFTRACKHRAYKRTELDVAVLESLAAVKRNGGEAPAEVREFLREVIPSQAVSGHRRFGGETEGVETRGLRPNNKGPQELPASSEWLLH